jgi:hypothetical protein
MATATDEQPVAAEDAVQAYWQLHGLDVYIQDAAQ